MKKITLDFYHRKSFADRNETRKLLEWLLEHPVFNPDKWAPFEPIRKPFDSGHLEESIESFANFEKVQEKRSWESWNGMLLLKRTKYPKSLSVFEWNHYKRYPFKMCFIDVEEKWAKNEVHLQKLVDFTHDIYSMFNGFWFAVLGLDAEREEKRSLRWFRPKHDHPNGGYYIEEAPGIFLHNGIPGIYWANYYGPFYVDWFGREKFEDLPCVFKKEMPDGGYFFTTAPSPWEWNSEEARKIQSQIRDHLGRDAFFDMEGLKNALVEKIAECAEITDDLPNQLIRPCRVPKFPFIEKANKGTSIISFVKGENGDFP